MSWKKLEDGSPTWNLLETPEIRGRLVEKQSDVGPHHSCVYVLETDDGPTNVWGSTVLDRLMKKVEIGQSICVKYMGERTGEKTGHSFKHFEVWMDDGEAE